MKSYLSPKYWAISTGSRSASVLKLTSSCLRPSLSNNLPLYWIFSQSEMFLITFFNLTPSYRVFGVHGNYAPIVRNALPESVLCARSVNAFHNTLHQSTISTVFCPVPGTICVLNCIVCCLQHLLLDLVIKFSFHIFGVVFHKKHV